MIVAELHPVQVDLLPKNLLFLSGRVGSGLAGWLDILEIRLNSAQLWLELELELGLSLATVGLRNFQKK